MLVELLTAAVLSVALVGTFGYLILTAGSNQPEISDRAADIQEARVVVERMTREIREGYVVLGTPTSSELSFNTFSGPQCGTASGSGDACRVTYTCTSGTCRRVEAATGGGGAGPPETLVTGLASNNVFTYAVGPSGDAHIDVRLIYPGEETAESVTISDGAELRNQ